MKLHIHFRNFVLAFTEYAVENFHSIIEVLHGSRIEWQDNENYLH